MFRHRSGVLGWITVLDALWCARSHSCSGVCRCAPQYLVLTDAHAWVSFLSSLQLCILVCAEGGKREEQRERELWLFLPCCPVHSTAEPRLMARSCSRFLQGHVVIKEGGVALNLHRVDLDYILGKNSLLWGSWDGGMNCPEKLWMSHPWNVQARLDGALSNLVQGVPAQDREARTRWSLRRLPVHTVLWFSKLWCSLRGYASPTEFFWRKDFQPHKTYCVRVKG